MKWSEFVSYQRMITPIVVRILFWVGTVVAVLGGLRIAMSDDFGQGLVIMVLGPVILRVCSEVLVVPFMINDKLTALQSKGK